MTREQMIAWFTIEGWEPVAGKHEAYLRGVAKDGMFVCCNVFIATYGQTIRIIYINEPRNASEWEVFPTPHLRAIYDKIWEKRK